MVVEGVDRGYEHRRHQDRQRDRDQHLFELHEELRGDVGGDEEQEQSPRPFGGGPHLRVDPGTVDGREVGGYVRPTGRFGFAHESNSRQSGQRTVVDMRERTLA